MKRVTKVILDFGVSRSDVAVYVFLAFKDPLKAKEIVDGMSSYKKLVYESFHKLMEKGLVFASCEVPRVFYALPFEKVLGLLTDKKRGEALLWSRKEENCFAAGKTWLMRVL